MFLVLAICVFLCVSVVSGNRLPVAYIRATDHYDAGFQVGKLFQTQIQDLWNNDTFVLNTELIPLYESAEGRKIYDQFVQFSGDAYPEIIDEVNGMADGIGIARYKALLMVLQPELEHFLPSYDSTAPRAIDEACSDILYMRNEKGQGPQIVIGHNEDNDQMFLQGAYMLTIDIEGTNVSTTGYSYPGELIGNTFGYNSYDLAMTCNALTPEPIQPGVGRYFINRALLKSNSIEAALETISNANFSSGFSYNIADRSQGRLINVEVAPQGVYDLLELTPEEGSHALTFHTNHYVRINITQSISNSSYYRYQKIQELVETYSFGTAQEAYDSIKMILGDTSNTVYPIYRTQTYPDYSYTLATAMYALSDYNDYIAGFITNPIDASPLFVWNVATSDELDAFAPKTDDNEDSVAKTIAFISVIGNVVLVLVISLLLVKISGCCTPKRPRPSIHKPFLNGEA
jgi:hypothetical protein